MELCVRCKRELGVGSVIPIEVKGSKVKMVHFWCATPNEVKFLYGTTPTVQIELQGDVP